MLTAVCQEIRNWFEREIFFDEFTIKDGNLEFDALQEGQYFRIVGSVFNDGVHQYPADDLKDETFTGSVWAMAVPKEIEDLANDITAYNTEAGVLSPYTSETWGGYSYTKAVGSDGSVVKWQTAFSDRLNRWRKI